MCDILSRLSSLGIQVREASRPVRLLFIKTTNLIEKTLLSTHCGLLLASSVNSCPLGFLRTRICIMSFLVTAKAYHSLIDKFGFRVLRLDPFNLWGWDCLFLAIGRLVTWITAAIADKLLIVHLLAHVTSIVMVVMMIAAHVMAHATVMPTDHRVEMSIHPVFLHREIRYLF